MAMAPNHVPRADRLAELRAELNDLGIARSGRPTYSSEQDELLERLDPLIDTSVTMSVVMGLV